MTDHNTNQYTNKDRQVGEVTRQCLGKKEEGVRAYVAACCVFGLTLAVVSTITTVPSL